MIRRAVVLVLVVLQVLLGTLVPAPARTGTVALRPYTAQARVALDRAPPAIERAAAPRRESSAPPPALPASFAIVHVAPPPVAGDVAPRFPDTARSEDERVPATARGPPRA